MAMLGKISARFAERGVRATLTKLFADRVYRRSTSVIVERRRGAARLGGNDALPEWLSFVIVRDCDDLPTLGAWLAPRSADFAAMQRAGKTGMFALADGVAVGCVWVSFADHHDPRLGEYYRVPAGEAYHYCWLVAPASRRTNVALPLCRFVIQTLEDMGIVRHFGVVDRVNRASYLVQQHFGYRECGQAVLHYHLFGRYWTRYRSYEGTLGPVKATR